MWRSCRNSRIVITRFIVNQVSKRYQSAAKVVLEPNLSKMSIYSGHIKGEFTNRLEFVRPERQTPIPIYQVLDSEGDVKDESQKPDVS